MFSHHRSAAPGARRNRAHSSPPPTDWAAQPRTITIICEVDRRAHEIIEEDVAAGRRSGNRQYWAICGYHFMLPAPRVAIAAPPCEQCAAVLAGRNRPC
ncbi:MAG: hypothetical protein JO272_07920 [Pseudonocardiales bacterium]|nr:hypothetical protein [Pseudonocardiales bacterium]